MLLTVSTSIPRTSSIGGGAPFLSVKVGGLSPPAFESGGAQAPPAPPISPPLLTMHGRPTAQDAFAILCAFVARWYANVLQLHTRLEVELDHGWSEARSRASFPPSESSGPKVHIQATVIARHACSHSAIYHWKLGPRTIRFKFSDKRLAYIVTQCL